LSNLRHSLGVVLCTYNGARYLRAQLESIAAQTRRPDVLLVFDDGSRDATIGQLEEFAAVAPFPIRIARNSKNLGYLRNFEQATSNCESDIIVLSDQDDWWRPDKLEQIEAVLARDARAGAVFSDADIVDENLDSLGYRLLDALRVNDEERAFVRSGRIFPVLLRRNIVCGATFAIRANWRDRVLPIPDGIVLHDEWIALVLAAHNGIRFIPDPLIRYRQHAANQIGLRRLYWRDQFRSLLRSRRPDSERLMKLMRSLHERLSTTGAPADALHEVEEKLVHVQRRLSMRGGRLMRVPTVTRELIRGRYSRYASGWRSALRDLVAPM